MTDTTRTADMAGVVEVAWADVVGAGFSRDERGRPAPREYWQAAQSLLPADVVQPPETIRSTLPHPVWSMRHVRVDGRGGHWCFAVQGRGGAFGPAGTCRFWFFPENGTNGWSPADAWSAGYAVARARQPEVPARARADKENVTGVLAALALGHKQIGVPGSPAEVARVLGAVLRVVPHQEVASRVWATCLLHPPEPRNRRLVAGRWPDEFWTAATPLPRYLSTLDQFLAAPLPTPEELNRLLDGRRREALDWLTNQARKPSPALAELLSQARSVAEVLNWRAANVPPSPAEVPALLATTDGRKRLHAHLDVLRDWAEAEPDQARRRLASERDPALGRELSTGLLAAQCRTAGNVLGLPLPGRPADGPSPERLAELVRETVPSLDNRAQLIRGLCGRTKVVSTEDDLMALHGWLLWLGLDPYGVGEDLFPNRTRAIVDVIQRQGSSWDQALAELQQRPDLFQRVIHRVGALDAARAAELLHDGAPSDAPDLVCAWATTLTQGVLAGNPAGGETWLRDLVSALRRRGAPKPFIQNVEYGGRSVMPPNPPSQKARRPSVDSCRLSDDSRYVPEEYDDDVGRVAGWSHPPEPAASAPRHRPTLSSWLRSRLPGRPPEAAPDDDHDRRQGNTVRTVLFLVVVVVVLFVAVYFLFLRLKESEPDPNLATDSLESPVESPVDDTVEGTEESLAARSYDLRYDCAAGVASEQDRREVITKLQQQLDDLRDGGRNIVLVAVVGECADELRSGIRDSEATVEILAPEVPITTGRSIAQDANDHAALHVTVVFDQA